MVNIVFAVFDKKSELHGPPFNMGTVGEALRAFQDLVQDERTTVSRHPEDFKLVRLGMFDNKTGEFVNAPRETLAHAQEFSRSQLGNVTPVGVKEG